MEQLNKTNEFTNSLNHEVYKLEKNQDWIKDHIDYTQITGLLLDERWETLPDDKGTVHKLRFAKYRNQDNPNLIYVYHDMFYRGDKKEMSKDLEFFRNDLGIFFEDGIEYYYQIHSKTNHYLRTYEDAAEMFGFVIHKDNNEPISIREMCNFSHELAVEKGFWEDYDRIMKDVSDNTTNMQYVKNLQLSQKLMLVVSELGESMEALRNLKFASINNILKTELFKLVNEKDIEKYKVLFTERVKDSVEDELADVFIRLGDLCKKFDIDIETYIKLKHEFNKTREKKHGKKF